MRISVGKLRGLQQISDDTGRFMMIAMDQRGSLQKMLHPEDPKAATYAEMEAVKLGVTSALAPHASGYILDPKFGVWLEINRIPLPGRTSLHAQRQNSTSGTRRKASSPVRNRAPSRRAAVYPTASA